MNRMEIKVKLLNKNARVPSYATEGSAAVDLCSAEDGVIRIEPGETRIIHTGIAVQIPQGYAGFVYARSGLSSKHGLAPANKVGVIDSDYRGEIMVSLLNHGREAKNVVQGERVAQLVVSRVEHCEFTECDELDNTKRGTGGFGSTGR